MRLRSINLLLLGLLILVIAVLGWRVMRVVTVALSVSQIERELYPENSFIPDSDALSRNLGKLRKAHNTFPKDQRLAEMFFEALLFEAYLNPEKSRDPLREVIPLGRSLYDSPLVDRQKIAAQVGWALHYAELPQEVTGWYGEMDSMEQWDSGLLVFYALACQAAMDDVEGALKTLENELEHRPSWFEGDAMAVTIYVILDEQERAGRHAVAAANQGIYMLHFLWGMGEYYLERENFVAAGNYFRQYYEESGRESEAAFELAVAIAGANGMDDPQLMELLDKAAENERHETSRSGLEASLYARLLDATGAEIWWSRLENTRQAYPNDYFVAAAVANASANARQRRIANAVDYESRGYPFHFQLPEPLMAAEEAAALASTDFQRQNAEMLLAYCCVSMSSPGNLNEAMLERCTTHLRRALGDPVVANPVMSERTPDYVSLIADKHVRSIRRFSPEFDLDLNHAIIDFLNRQRAEFEEVTEYPPLEYKEVRALTESGAATST